MTDSEPLLSVIITSYTTERLNNLCELLDRLAAQTYRRLEIVFVGERTPELCDRVRAHADETSIPRVRVLLNEGPYGANWARNMGIRQAEGELLAFVDDDALPFPDWAEELVKTYADPTIVGVTGPILPLWEDEAMSWFPEQLDWVVGCTMWSGITEQRPVRSVNGTNSSFRRQALAIAGPYATALGPHRADRAEWREFAEETELSLRVRQKTGKEIVHNPRVRVYHRVPRSKFTPGWMAQRSFQVGRTRRMIRTLHDKNHRQADILSPERQLLKRILEELTPGAVKQLPARPLVAARTIAITGYVLFFVALGYYSYSSRRGPYLVSA